jgi:hypothetical protein
MALKADRTTLEAIAKMDVLTDGWDGAGAVAPTQEAIDSAREVAKGIDWTLVAAAPDGCIIFERHESGNYLEAEVQPSGAVEWMEIVQGVPNTW